MLDAASRSPVEGSTARVPPDAMPSSAVFALAGIAAMRMPRENPSKSWWNTTAVVSEAVDGQ